MSERYKTETVECAEYHLPEGWYTLRELKALVAEMEERNERVKKLIEQPPKENQDAKTL